MKILAIDTSCDDTACSIVKIKNQKSKIKNLEVLANVVSSQIKLHSRYGGVYPILAKREHQRNLPFVLMRALKQAGLISLKLKVKSDASLKLQLKVKNLNRILEREEVLRPRLLNFLERHQKPKIDAIAVTVGPGLEPCLWVGVNFARTLAYWWGLPIIPVNHLEAHLFANWLTPIGSKSKIKNQKSKLQLKSQKFQKPKMPAVGLVVSGGNTQLFLIKDIGKYKLLGETRDDAAGECFDKTARILGLGYPGGPLIAALAAMKLKVKSALNEPGAHRANREKLKIKLPRPMINSNDYDFSFSGLKTAVLYDYKKRKKAIRESDEYKTAMAKEIQQAVIDVLIKKTFKAVKEYKAKSILLGGGVASNLGLKQQLKVKSDALLKLKVSFLVPEKKLCTDNAAMVAVAGFFHFQNQKKWDKIKADANLVISPAFNL